MALARFLRRNQLPRPCPGEFLIKFREETSAAQRQSVLARHECGSHPAFSDARDLITSAVASAADKVRPIAKAFAAEDDVVYAQPNFVRHITADRAAQTTRSG